MSAFGRKVATELGLQRPVVWVGVVDMVAFLRVFLWSFVLLSLVCELGIVACDAGMKKESYLRLVRRGLDELDIDQCRSNICDAIAKGEMVTEQSGTVRWGEMLKNRKHRNLGSGRQSDKHHQTLQETH